MKYRKKIAIDAYQIPPNTGTAPEPAPRWLIEAIVAGTVVTRPEGGVVVKTLEGEMTGEVGDWIIRGVQGELHPCRADIFAASYEAAE